MSGQAYAGTAGRGFRQAVIQLLESQYGVLGSQRVLDLLAEDLERLVEQFYPARQRVSSGWMVFTGTRASGGKAHPGRRVGEHELVTLAWPVLLAEDVQELAQGVPDGAENQPARRGWLERRLTRIVEYGLQHPQGPVLLTLADLAAMLGLTTVQVSQRLKEARRKTGKALPTKGYYFDQGMRPTHKQEILELYEAGVDEADIARRTEHAPESVGKYIRDYERVKLLLQHNTPIHQISGLAGLQPGVVRAHCEILRRFHPELVPETHQVP